MKLIKLLTVCGLLIFAACKKDNCKDVNCLNGGICNDGKCDCPPGYSGTNCETKDSCYNVDCGWGDCNNGKCNCLPTFYGEKCDSNGVNTNIYVVKNLAITPGSQPEFNNYVNRDDSFVAQMRIDTSMNPYIVYQEFHQLFTTKTIHFQAYNRNDLLREFILGANNDKRMRFDGVIQNNGKLIQVTVSYFDAVNPKYKDFVKIADFDFVAQ